MTLVVVMLLTAFLSEFSFTTGLELRSVQTFRDRYAARSLARAAFRAVQMGLLGDEVVFMAGYRQLHDILQFSAVPWESGTLVALEIQPLDPLFNLNRLDGLKVNSAQDIVLHEVFQNLLADAIPEPDETTTLVQPLPPESVSRIYAALFDWIDEDAEPYDGFAAVRGAEASAYFNERPEYTPKNAPLDRLSEIRAVRGVADSRIRWRDWRSRFTIVERDDGNLYPGLINPNVATREEIVRFLQARRLDGALTEDLPGAIIDIQLGLNEYADLAEVIADELAPPEGALPDLNGQDIQAALKRAGAKPNLWDQAFSVADEYFAVVLTTEVNGVEADLEAVLHTPGRSAERTAPLARVVSLRIH